MGRRRIALDDHATLLSEYQRTRTLPDLVVPELSATELWERLGAHRSYEYWPALLEAIVSAPDADPMLLSLISEGETDPEVLNAVAVSSRTPTETLSRLAQTCHSPSVRQHAQLNLIHRRMHAMSPGEIRRVLSEYAGDAGIALGVRHLFASDAHTPVEILRELAKDESDLVRLAAEQNLERR